MLKTTLIFLSVALTSLEATNKQTGYASWYGKENAISSSGKPIQHTKYPALAHKKIPLGTKVKITNLKNNKSVIAVVEDRGPYAKNRIADLNISAAKNIGMIQDGVVPITLEVLD